MKLGEVNDLGLGKCAVCKEWKELPSLHPKDRKKPRKDRQRVCSTCYTKVKRLKEPLFFVKKSISAHKCMSQEGDYTTNDIKELHQWQAFKCPYCNNPIHYNFTLDHIVPKNASGRNILTNILLVCQECNSSKQAYELTYWLEFKSYKVKPKILQKIKGAYDEHGYDFKASCEHCEGSRNTAVCANNTASTVKVCIRRETPSN